MSIILKPSIAPNLPIAPAEPSQVYLNELTNALRLYFKQVDNFTSVASKNITITQSAYVAQWLGL
jgi:hypothetical protein